MLPVNSITLQDATGSLTAADTSEPVEVGSYKMIVIHLDITTLTTADGDDEVDFYIQTTYDGSTWFDMENIHFTTADDGTTPTKILTYDSYQSAASARDVTDGTLADDTKLDLPLGVKVRIKTAVTGATAPTYAYQAHGIKRN